MTRIAIAPTGTASFPDGGGHWWVYLQYVYGLRDLGVRVHWLERCAPDAAVEATRRRLTHLGFDDDEIHLYEVDPEGRPHWRTERAAAEAGLERVEALLDFDYRTPAAVVDRVRRSALVDIDPGLLQTWWARGEVDPAGHDVWITTGETVGTDTARFPDCGVPWQRVRPCVHLPSWPVVEDVGPAFTTVTSWWGDEWLTLADGTIVENNKRVPFVGYADLPRRTGADLEIAAYFGTSRGADPTTPPTPDTVDGDGDDVARLLAGGWRLRRSASVASGPEAYRSYVRGSYGEFSCVKPSCRIFQNAWISDRTLCYLASGLPAVVEHTGASDVLDAGLGLLRFRDVDEAEEAIRRVRSDPGRHRRAARDLAEAYFSTAVVLPRILEAVENRPLARKVR